MSGAPRESGRYGRNREKGNRAPSIIQIEREELRRKKLLREKDMDLNDLAKRNTKYDDMARRNTVQQVGEKQR